jgi:hypothetical protein
MLDDSTYSTSHGAVGVHMAVNLESDGKNHQSQETAEQRQKKLQNVRERAMQRS